MITCRKGPWHHTQQGEKGNVVEDDSKGGGGGRRGWWAHTALLGLVCSCGAAMGGQGLGGGSRAGKNVKSHVQWSWENPKLCDSDFTDNVPNNALAQFAPVLSPLVELFKVVYCLWQQQGTLSANCPNSDSWCFCEESDLWAHYWENNIFIFIVMHGFK